jgi:hypothetical protein
MAGNEIEVCRFLFLNRKQIHLNHIGLVEEVAAPIKGSDRYLPIQSLDDLASLSTSHAGKKADIYINGQGVSIKQLGGSFSFNRLQRANLLDMYTMLGLMEPETLVANLDQAVHSFHQGQLPGRSQSWQGFFSEQDFKTLILFLMLKGSPNHGLSDHPAEFILEASKTVSQNDDLVLYSFDEYFEQYKLKLKVAIRRQWIGQESNSEHSRALGLSRKSGNSPWIFDEVVGQPKPHSETQRRWREDVPESDRRTVYFLMIEKKK